MKNISRAIFSVFLISYILLSCKTSQENDEKYLWGKAQDICKTNLILDSHIDWPEKHIKFPDDISKLKSKGDFDLQRAENGGLNAVFSVAYIPYELNEKQGRLLFDSLVNLITDYTLKYPDKFALAKKPSDVRDNFEKGLMSFPLCLENGSPVGDSLAYLNYLKEKDITYITLCHSKSNQICDANFDPVRKWSGLSPFGKEMIKEMNKLGIMVDISHSTDSTVFQALEISRAPIIASHSSCRYFTPGFERNLPDTLIKAIAAKGGIVMLNFGSAWLDAECNRNWMYLYYKWQDSTGIALESEEGGEFLAEYGETHKLQSDVKRLADHIDHIVKIAGIDYIGIGSDFDGLIKQSLPVDLQDVSCYPSIVAELLSRGYKVQDIEKILSKNFLRVWSEVIKTSESLKNN